MSDYLMHGAGRIVMAAIIALLSGCGSLSKGINRDGTHAQHLIWPVADDMNALAAQGSYPTPEALSMLHPGLTKKQIQKLIGPPHFNEGFATREWDYLFHLARGDKSGTIVCQFKILFTSSDVAGSQYWLPEGCARQGANLSP